MKNDTGLSVKEETIEDAILAADFLRKDSRIDSNKIFIIGHSLGGMLAPRIDAEGGNFAGIIIMGGSPRKLEEILMDQNNDVLNSLNKFLKMIARKQIAALSSKFDNIYNLSDEEAKSTTVLGKYLGLTTSKKWVNILLLIISTFWINQYSFCKEIKISMYQ